MLDVESTPVRRYGASSLASLPKQYQVPGPVTPVNQHGCGACWAIAAVQAMNDRTPPTATGSKPALSIQHMIDCNDRCIVYKGRRGCSDDCEGGFLLSAFVFLQEHGIPVLSRAERQITAKRPCDPLPPQTEMRKIKDFYIVNQYDTFGLANAHHAPLVLSASELLNNERCIMAEIHERGSVSACFNLFSDLERFFSNRRSDDMVYTLGWELPETERSKLPVVGNVKWGRGSTSTPQTPGGTIRFRTSHSVSVVGWGETQTGVKYWVVRNSWGTPAHNGGFFRILRGRNTCGIESDVVACTVDPTPTTAGDLPTAQPRKGPPPPVDDTLAKFERYGVPAILVGGILIVCGAVMVSQQSRAK